MREEAHMAKRKIPIIQIAINADNESNETIVALREDGEIFKYHIPGVYDESQYKPQWRKMPSVPDDE